MRIAAFISHPIQYFTPLWQELSKRTDVDLTVFYFSRQGLDHTLDPGFGVHFAWDIDLLAGHRSEFLPRQWPTRDSHDHRGIALNRGISRALRRGWDAVFVNGYVHLNNWFIVLACQQLGIPVLCFADTTMHAEPHKPAWKKKAKRAALSQFVPRVGAFLAAGGQSRAYFEHYGAPPDRIFICPYAVDVPRFRSAQREGASAEQRAALHARFGIPLDRKVAMFCGKLVDWKRPLDLLAALARLERDDCVAVFVGDGPLRSRIERDGGSRVVVTGFVNQREIPLALSLADVLVLCSEFEPYGMVVSEAQVLGIPAIVSDACGCHGPESVLQDGVSGFVYPTGDTVALAQRLTRILGDSALHARMSAAARVQGDTQSQLAAASGFLAAVARAGKHAPAA